MQDPPLVYCYPRFPPTDDTFQSPWCSNGKLPSNTSASWYLQLERASSYQVQIITPFWKFVCQRNALQKRQLSGVSMFAAAMLHRPHRLVSATVHGSAQALGLQDALPRDIATSLIVCHERKIGFASCSIVISHIVIRKSST